MDQFDSPEIIQRPDELLPVEKCQRFIDLLTSVNFALFPSATSVSRTALEGCCLRFGVKLEDEIQQSSIMRIA